MMLIASQRKISTHKSKAAKYNKAACENKALRVTIALAPVSYSKYSIKKTKHKISAKVRTAKKNAETSSKHRTSSS